MERNCLAILFLVGWSTLLNEVTRPVGVSNKTSPVTEF